MTIISAFSLLVRQTADEFLTAALEVAELVGLPVTTWRAGDPTRTMFRADASAFEQLDAVRVEYAKSAFLETAEGDWLKLRATDTYGVTPEEATFATSTVTLNNASGGLYELSPGGLIVSNAITGATYTNQATFTLNPSSSLDVSIVAQEAGAGGSASVNDISIIVSPTLTGVTITASTAAIGSDAQSDVGIREQCLATLGALSPAGPADAYEFVARSSTLTGIQGVARAKADGDNTDGTVTVYVATLTAGLDAPSVAAIQAAIEEWAEPIAIQATVEAGVVALQNVNLTLTPAAPALQDVLESAIASYFATIDFGGTVSPSGIIQYARNAAAEQGVALTHVVVNTPSLTALASNEFPVLQALVLS